RQLPAPRVRRGGAVRRGRAGRPGRGGKAQVGRRAGGPGDRGRGWPRRPGTAPGRLRTRRMARANVRGGQPGRARRRSANSSGNSGTSTAAELSTEVVHDRLREAILRGEFDPRVPLSQVQLAARLGVSRTPLREALRMLQREGLIDSEPNRRVRVAQLSVADAEQLYAARVMVEALAVRLTVPAYTASDLAELKATLAQMAKLSGRDIDVWEAVHQRYHRLLRKYAGERITRL